MALPWVGFTCVAIIAAQFVTTRREQWTYSWFTGTFAAVWLSLFSCWALWAVILYPKIFSPLIGLPEPENPSFWNGQWSRIQKEPTGVPMMDWVNNVPNKGVIRYLGMFNQERVLVTSPQALAEVLTTKNYQFMKPKQLRYQIGRILGVGVLLAEGDEHKFQRRNLMPAFAFRHIKDLYPVFWEKAREGVRAMSAQILEDAAKGSNSQRPEKESDGKTAAMEVGNWASRMTLDIVGVAGLGRDFGAIKDPNNELIKTYTHLFRPNRQAQILGLLSQVIPARLIAMLPIRRNEDVMQAARIIRSTCRDLIREKKERLARKELTDVDILSVALESGGFTEENLVDQLMTFLAAGHETTASAMTWAIYMLCLYPEVQTRLRQEVRERLPPLNDDAAAVSSLDIDHMPYLNAVCNEVLRYYGPVPMTLREAAHDTSIQGHYIPEGTRVIIAPWATNKDKGLWGPDADKFNPDRWLPKFEGDKAAASGGATSNYAFLTFLHGPRSCIGSTFAKAEFACLLAAWVGRIEFELRNKEEMDEKKILIKGGVTARPAKGLHVYAKVVDEC